MMCEKIVHKRSPRGIDPCLVDEFAILMTDEWKKKYQGTMSCCGHGRYSKILIVLNKVSGIFFEWFSGINLPDITRKDTRKSFCLKDAEGYYYIPEVEER